MLLEPRTLQRGYFRQATVKKILEQHMRGKRDYSTWIWCLMILEMWFRTYLDQPLGSDAGGIVERPSAPGHPA
jgi:asparagine synthase (glutamine-hydrolysing)